MIANAIRTLIHLARPQRSKLTEAREARVDATLKLRRSPEWRRPWLTHCSIPLRVFGASEQLIDLKVAVYRRQKRNCK